MKTKNVYTLYANFGDGNGFVFLRTFDTQREATVTKNSLAAINRDIKLRIEIDYNVPVDTLRAR